MLQDKLSTAEKTGKLGELFVPPSMRTKKSEQLTGEFSQLLLFVLLDLLQYDQYSTSL
jgi:hypothetical protein